LQAQSQLNVRASDMDEGVLLRARILMAQGKMSEATTCYNQLAMNDRAGERARVQALVDMSVYLYNSGKTDEAIAYARTAFERAKQGELRRLAGFRLGDLLSASAQTIGEADKVIKGLVRDYPDDPASIKAYLKLADAYLHVKRPERAAAEYQMFLEAYPEQSLNERALQARAWALFQLGRYTEAVGLFQRVAEQTTNPVIRAECRFKQGDALLADQRFEDAAKVYRTLAETQPESEFAGRALYQGAECLERAGAGALAGVQYAQTAARYPTQEYAPKALLRLALLQASTNDYAGATQTYTTIQNNYPQKGIRSEALMGRGRIAYRLFKFEEAMQDFATVSETDLERRDEARMLITFCLYGLGRDKDARQSGTTFLVDFPESRWLPEMVLWLGKCDFNRGRFSEAKTFFLDYVTRWPKQSAADAALLWAARASASMGDFTGTVELIGRFVREYPKSPRQIEARLVQADALFELARFADVVLVLDQVLADATATGEWIVQAKIRRADGFFAMGADNSERYQKALAGYREVLEQSTLTPAEVLQLNYKVARCQEKLRKIDDALTTYYTDVILRYQNERAKGVWYDDAATALYVRAAFNMADLYEQRGQPTQAVNVLKRMIEVDVPGKEEALHRIGRLEKQR
ncbi:MAG: tetratricopeptide repeat protein, partial [Clostridia bacterium]|nr:tetratricopeptide repeat protein [Clostridia bacterium]